MDWIEQFKGLNSLPPYERKRLLEAGRVVRHKAGTVMFGRGTEPNALVLLLEGNVRVQQTSDTGRDIVLYRVEAGQSCVLTTACLLAHESYAAEGIAETDIKAVSIPRSVFDSLMSDSPAFRDFVLSAYGRRITDLFRVIDEVAFGRIDVRLADRLLVLAGDKKEIAATHQKLATELGTAREVISRQLQEFQKRDLIEQSRGRIAITDRENLTRLAESA